MLVFGQSARKKQLARKPVTLYGHAVDEVLFYDHVGIRLNVYQNTTERTTNVAAKMRGGLMSILSSRLNLSELSCITTIKLYKTIVLPRSLYGAELWHKMNKEDLSRLETAHRFCLKKIQDFPKRAKSALVECSAKCYQIATYIDQKKLLFIGRLCRLSCKKLAKRVFVERLFQHQANYNVKNSGIVFNLLDVLSTYNLRQYIELFLSDAIFPDKNAWKSLVRQAIETREHIGRDTSF